MWTPSARYLAEIKKGSYTAVSKIELWNSDIYLSNVPFGPGAQVTVDETRQVRRQLTFTVPSRGRPADQWIPRPDVPTDLLNPLSGNELRPYRGLRYADGTEEYIPLGVFGMSKPSVIDSGGTLSVSITGNDRSADISARGWTDPYPIAAGTNLGTAVQALLNNRRPGLIYNFTPTDAAVPASAFGTDVTQQSDPYADATTLVTAAGMELFFDVLGQPTMRPISDPATEPITGQFVEGDGTIVTIGRTLDESLAYNGVIVVGNGTGGQPVRGEAWDTDPSSPTYFQGTWGERPYRITTALVPYPGQSNASAVAQVNAIAAAQFHIVCLAMDAPTLTVVPDPTKQEGDCILLTRQRAEIDAEYAISTMTIPLDVNVAMSINGRPRRST